MSNPEQVAASAFETLFDVLNNNVQSVTLSTGETRTLQRDGSNYWMGSFPFRNVDTFVEDDSSRLDFGKMEQRDAYPFGVIPNPTNNQMQDTYRVFQDRVEFDVTVVDNRAESTTRFRDAVESEVLKNINTFYNDGFYRVNTGQSIPNTGKSGDMKMHTYEIPVRMRYDVKMVY